MHATPLATVVTAAQLPSAPPPLSVGSITADDLTNSLPFTTPSHRGRPRSPPIADHSSSTPLLSPNSISNTVSTVRSVALPGDSHSTATPSIATPAEAQTGPPLPSPSSASPNSLSLPLPLHLPPPFLLLPPLPSPLCLHVQPHPSPPPRHLPPATVQATRQSTRLSRAQNVVVHRSLSCSISVFLATLLLTSL
jgi:hypothetical protein